MLGPASLVYFLKFKYESKKKTPNPLGIDGMGLDVWGGHDQDEDKYELPEIKLVVDSEDVVAKTRKLKSYIDGNTDFNSDLQMDKLAQDIINEFNHEHLTDIYNNAGTVAVWDRATALGDTESEKFESLYVKFCEISSVIHRKTLRGTANFFVASQKTYEKHKKALEAYNPTKTKVYVPEGWDRPGILMGYAGESYLDRGYAYCPYVPFSRTPTIISEDFCPRPGLLSRYGKKLMKTGAKHFARLEIKNDD